MSINHPRANVQVCAISTVKSKCWMDGFCTCIHSVLSSAPKHFDMHLTVIQYYALGFFYFFLIFSALHCREEILIWDSLTFDSFLEQRLLALEARNGRELQGLQSEKQQLQELLERQSRLVSQLQGELGSSMLNSTLLQRQQAMLTGTVQQLLAMVNNCNGKAQWVHCVWISYFTKRYCYSQLRHHYSISTKLQDILFVQNKLWAACNSNHYIHATLQAYNQSLTLQETSHMGQGFVCKSHTVAICKHMFKYFCRNLQYAQGGAA